MSTLIRSEAVAFYAARVRAELAGVDPDVLDELTDGLAADLTEALLDGMPQDADPAAYLTDLAVEDVDARFGSPRDYASELAAAADVVVPAPEGAGRPRRGLRAALADTRAGLRADREAFVARHGWMQTSLEFLHSLRPLWWVARGWGLYILAFALIGRRLVHARHQFLPGELLGWVVLLGLVIASVQVGRHGLWRNAGWRRSLLRLVGVATAVSALVGVVALTSVATTDHAAQSWQSYEQGLQERENGVFIDGRPASNLFVYDPEGRPVDGARILDQDGRPVLLGMPEYAQETWGYVGNSGQWFGDSFPSALLPGGGDLHQYPYRYVPNSSLDTDVEGDITLAPNVTIPPTEWPEDSLPALPGLRSDSGHDEDSAASTSAPDDVP